MKRFLTLLLAFLMLVTAFVACDNGKTPGKTPGGDGTGSGSGSGDDEIDEDAIINAVKPKDYGNVDFTFLTVGSSERYCKEIFCEVEDTEDTLYESVYRRNDAVSAHLKVNIKNMPAADPVGEAKLLVSGGDTTVEVYNLPQHGSLGFLSMGYARDWNELDLQYDKKWWNPDAMKNLTLDGKIFTMSGSILVTEIEAAVAMAYNKNLYDEFQLTYDIYQSVLDGDWVLDDFIALVSQVKADLNGDSTVEIGTDIVGFSTDAHSMAMNWPFACGFVNSSVKDGTYKVSVDSGKVTTMLEKLAALFKTEYADQTAEWNAGISYFSEGKSFIRALTLYELENLRGMDDDYGVIPFPKYDTKQKNYATHAAGVAPIMLIPIQNNTHDEYLTDVLESMAQASDKITKPTYYELVLKEKGTRDETAKQVMDMILAARTYDFAYISQMGVAWVIGGMVGGGTTNFTRTWDRSSERTLRTLQTAIDEILENAGA